MSSLPESKSVDKELLAEVDGTPVESFGPEYDFLIHQAKMLNVGETKIFDDSYKLQKSERQAFVAVARGVGGCMVQYYFDGKNVKISGIEYRV